MLGRALLTCLLPFFCWGRSSAGRAPALQAGGRRFDPDRLHHFALGLGGVEVKGILGFQTHFIAEKSAHSMFCPCHSQRRARTKHRWRPRAPQGVLGRVVLSYCKSGSGASLGALSVNPSLTGWRIFRDHLPFDRGNYVQRRCGHLPLVMAVGPTCVLLSDEACCVWKPSVFGSCTRWVCSGPRERFGR